VKWDISDAFTVVNGSDEEEEEEWEWICRRSTFVGPIWRGTEVACRLRRVVKPLDCWPVAKRRVCLYRLDLVIVEVEE
jgi:hypothetical protein